MDEDRNPAPSWSSQASSLPGCRAVVSSLSQLLGCGPRIVIHMGLPSSCPNGMTQGPWS